MALRSLRSIWSAHEISPAALFQQLLTQLFERQRVDDVSFRQPAFASDARPEAEITGVVQAVSIAVNDAFDAFALRVGPQAPVHVEAHRMGIDFDPGAGFGAGVNDGALVQLVWL